MESQITKFDPAIQDRFLQFSRNGRWGTCIDCPRDTNGHAYPEFCKNTDRYDHQLNVDALAETYNALMLGR